MEKERYFLLVLCLVPLLASCTDLQVYVVYLGHHQGNRAHHEIEAAHYQYLYSLKNTNEEEARSALLYSYKNHINGFAASLTAEEASKLSRLEEVISVFPSHGHTTQTTRSWEFVGLNEEGHGVDANLAASGNDLLLKAQYGKNMIIGVVDSGVWPESKSFNDDQMYPVAQSWKGICQNGDAFNSSICNRKIVGARYYTKAFIIQNGPNNFTRDTVSARDVDGHGTHTASIAAGSRVWNASAYGGYAKGMASGGAPLAHVAIYKACWAMPNQEKIVGNTCYDADLLAAIDDAIADGVHVLSISIGTNKTLPYTADGIAIGAFHAAKHDIVVVCAAGNRGPHPASLANPAPWIITVGASSVDRVFTAPVILGDGRIFKGQSVTPRKDPPKQLPLVFAAEVERDNLPANQSGQCLPKSLSPAKAKGKVVLCMRGLGFRVAKGVEVKRAGGKGFILGNTPMNASNVAADSHVLPASHLTADDTIAVLRYINTTKNPTALIQASRTILNCKPAPFMANFTSRGPNPLDPNILKPDVTAPGLSILAAWSGADPPSKIVGDDRIVGYNILSGTSMAAPHVAAAAALLRAIHPEWSSAAIRSALMTTASTNNNQGSIIKDDTGKPADAFQFGAGHISPHRAADPGLVYDTSFQEYADYLNSYGIDAPNGVASYDLNYPSIAAPRVKKSVTYLRTVTNVGRDRCEYKFSAEAPAGYAFDASPSVLRFDAVGERISFKITITKIENDEAKSSESDYVFGWYSWISEEYRVRSPVAISRAL